ncbi:MAG: EamA family transporter [Tissierellales bacterium]|nr:EamA family transporter [Tissierellales bacterium]MBN2826438.1 EamA family transporter [Tissierellales bacterium]
MNCFYKGVFLILLSALGFSFLPIFATYAYSGGISVSTLLFIRFLASSLLFFSYAYKKSEKIKLDKGSLLPLFLLGAIGYNLQSRFYLSSLKYVTPSLAALFLYTYPVTVSLLSYLFEKEKITKKSFLSMGLSFLGLFLILGHSAGTINMKGVLFALSASLVYSIYIITSNRIVKITSPLITSAYIALFSAFGTFIIGIFSRDISFAFSSKSVLPVAGIVLVSTVLAMLTFFAGMEILGPTKSSVISLMEAVFTVILSSVILHDYLTFVQLIGGIAVLSGAYIIIRSKASPSEPL